MPMWVATGNDIGNPSMDTLAQWISSAETEMNVLHGHYESKQLTTVFGGGWPQCGME